MDQSLVQGLFALGGAVVGAGASFGSTYWMDRARWGRERESRWDARRLEAYTEYATSVKMSIIQSRSILGSMGLSPTLTPTPADVGLPKLAEIELERTSRLEAVMLLANARTVASAREWHNIAWKFHKWAAGTVPTDAAEVEAEYAVAQEARERFYAAARAELDVMQIDH